LRLDRGLYSFTIKPSANSEPTHFVWNGMVEYYKLAGDYLYFTGNLANGPPGIWKYNIKSQEVRCLDSGLKTNFQYTKMVTPIGGMGTNRLGEQINYHIWEPTHVSSGKKYPLIIGQTHYMWFSYQQIAANAGYYFASADRLSWWDGLDHWGADVMELYQILAKDPNIDTDRIYLFATSVESESLRQFVAEKPDLWRGVILFNPVAAPNLSNMHLSRIFIVGGRDDDNPVEQLIKYQDRAAKAGIPVNLFLQNGVQHITRSIATERELTRQFARFLLQN
jgi:dipeptidyl aminopeptidase/acylaminoacyl peptidase